MASKRNLFSKLIDFCTYKESTKPKEFYIPEPEELGHFKKNSSGEDYSSNNNNNNKDKVSNKYSNYEVNSEENNNSNYDDTSKSDSNSDSNDSKNFSQDKCSPISKKIQENIDFINESLNADQNKDIIVRRFVVGGKYSAFISFIDGAADTNIINNFILRPLLNNSILNTEHIAYKLDSVILEVIETNPVTMVVDKNEILFEILSGNTALFIDGCNYFIISNTRSFPKRGIDRPQIESGVAGSQEAFTESVGDNVALIRKSIRNRNLTAEYLDLGEVNNSSCAILYIKGITNPAIINEVKRRIDGIKSDYVSGSGLLSQYIEDNRFSLFPTILTTERPDRTVSHLLEGKVAILVDGVPFSDIVPVTFTAFMHSADDAFMRWQFGTFLRIIRFTALFIALLLPGIYVAITTYHQEMIPTELLIAIAKSKEEVPFPTIIEVLLMEVSFELIREAGIRIPGMIGNTLGIIGALILGQAAVEANIVSPILIIIVAVTGLSNFSIPNYSFASSIRVLRFVFIFAGALLGFYGMTIALIIVLSSALSRKSFGVNFFSPFAPVTDKGNDYIIKYPAWEQEYRPDYLNTLDPVRQPKVSRKWSQEDPKYTYERNNKDE